MSAVSTKPTKVTRTSVPTESIIGGTQSSPPRTLRHEVNINLIFNKCYYSSVVVSRQEALEAAISERDAQLGLLEVSGIKTARAAERADDLRADRKRLMQLMKQQVKAIQPHFASKWI